jgi:hypothetical protein
MHNIITKSLHNNGFKPKSHVNVNDILLYQLTSFKFYIFEHNKHAKWNDSIITWISFKDELTINYLFNSGVILI